MMRGNNVARRIRRTVPMALTVLFAITSIRQPLGLYSQQQQSLSQQVMALLLCVAPERQPIRPSVLQHGGVPSTLVTKTRTWTRMSSFHPSTTPAHAHNASTISPSSIILQSRKIQQRTQPARRKPKYYWQDLDHVEKELDLFWTDRGVTLAFDSSSSTSDSSKVQKQQIPVVIPNECLLRHYRRHDLRGAITSHGGRFLMAEKLRQHHHRSRNGTSTMSSPQLRPIVILSGTWSDAVQQSIELRTLIQLDQSLTRTIPPWKNQDQLTLSSSDSSSTLSSWLGDHRGPDNRGYRRWMHRSCRRPKGYWNNNRTLVIQELYNYVDAYKVLHNRPSTWMPRPSELIREGRSDLKEAGIRLFGSFDAMTQVAGMIPHREWQYMEGQLEVILELKRFCDEQQNGDYTQFPCATKIRNLGYDRLYHLIQYYGGRKHLALRLGMSQNFPNTNIKSRHEKLDWGRFDLDFASRLLLFVREDQLRNEPPLKIHFPSHCRYLLKGRSIRIPSSRRLVAYGEEGIWLRIKILEYGGFENVCRRLGLAFVEVNFKSNITPEHNLME